MNEKKIELISQIISSQKTYLPDSGLVKQLTASLSKLSLVALGQLATVVSLANKE